jgi:pyruvate/2-oxoglutarate/acetoin dehydrogenase E1 component
MGNILIMTYKDKLTETMTCLGEMEDTIFLGQQILFPGNPMSSTLSGVNPSKLIELPVMEDSQMGMSLGLAMTGKFVITIYPRWDFLICATNQIVNHVDKIELMTNGKWLPNMIIRVGKGSDKPLNPGHQHKGNYFDELNNMTQTIRFFDCNNVDEIKYAYEFAINKGGINLINEYPENYGI